MRAAFTLLALFAIAVAAALFAGNNQAVVTLFWPPHRVDVSFNLALVGLIGVFALLYAALRASSAVVSLPGQARRWRAQQKERAMHGALMEALAHLMAGRYIRATKAAQNALLQEKSLAQMMLTDSGSAAHREEAYGDSRSHLLQTLAHVLAAESAQALQNKTLRDSHLQQALSCSAAKSALELREGVQLRAARWALDDRDPASTLQWLAQLPQGALRRTLALRMKLRASRYLRRTPQALDTARLLAKHRAFSSTAATSILRGLALELLSDARDPAQLQIAWGQLEPTEQALPEVVVHAASRLLALHGDEQLARSWLLGVWAKAVSPQSELADLGDALRVKIFKVLASSLDSLDTAWLSRIEAAQIARPQDANLQYLAGMACMKLSLWGKATALLNQAARGLQDLELRRSALIELAKLAEQRGDPSAAAAAYKDAATLRFS